MTTYNFICKECGHEQFEVFSINDYDKKITKDGKLKRKKCDKCKTIALYRHITVPGIIVPNNGYVSMERWWQQNPGAARRKEDELMKKLDERKQKKLDKVDRGKSSNDPSRRHKDYGSGQQEEKLK